MMRGLVLAVVLAVIAAPAWAQPPSVTVGLSKLAEAAVRDGLIDPDSAEFRSEEFATTDWLKHGAFGKRVEGPASIICGQYNSKNRSGGYSGYAWFFVAVKDGQVLWSDVDEGADDVPGVAYYGCKNAGLAG